MSQDQGGHAHNHAAGANSKMLAIALGLTTTFLIAELIGSFVFNSLALLSDAAHMFTDSAALAIALAAVKIGQRPADDALGHPADDHSGEQEHQHDGNHRDHGHRLRERGQRQGDLE